MNFVTLFDKNYLSRGIALYQSLQKNCSADFCLYVLALDDFVADFFTANAGEYKNVIVETLSQIKAAYPVLEKLQQQRTRAEFSWTLSSFSIQYVIKKYSLASCTYLDADTYFYADPQTLLDEVGEKSVLITPHNYTPRYDQSATSGRYCVQFVYFKNDEDGNKVLEWWRAACEECCCGVPANGKFGDQKYLDDWLSRFSGIVHECQNVGAGVAPWNVQKFDVREAGDALFVTDKITKITSQVIFFHFHSLKAYLINGQKKWQLCGYEISPDVVEIFYKKYIRTLNHIEETNCIQNALPNLEQRKTQYCKLILQAFKENAKMFVKSFMIWKTVKNLHNTQNAELQNILADQKYA